VSHPQVRENVPLAPLTTLGIGGPARFMIEAVREEDIPEALRFAGARSCPVFVLGGGSNVLVSDAGFPGLVLRIGMTGVRGFDDPGQSVIRGAAGEPWDGFVQATVERDFAGIECLSGIPGCIGGTPVQNVGAYGQEVSDVITSVRAFDLQSLDVVEIGSTDCGFGYRSSIFNTSQAGRHLILSVDFALKGHGAARVRYPDLRHRFEGRTTQPSLAEVRDAVLRTRAAKGMVLTPGDPDALSAGSFFRNPVVDCASFDGIAQRARGIGLLGEGEVLPSFAAPDNGVKLPAAWLIERAGFHKGYGHGRVGISSRHTLALVNRGGATAAELLTLAREIQDGVRAVFGIDLVPEPVFVGFGPGGDYAAFEYSGPCGTI
jgi:UDP-N-acetylmuramate dehydrogenase